MSLGRTPSRQLIDHAIQVVLQMRYRRAIKKMLPEGEEMIVRDARTTGRGIKRMQRRGSKNKRVERSSWFTKNPAFEIDGTARRSNIVV